jgi:hypothetical protein
MHVASGRVRRKTVSLRSTRHKLPCFCPISVENHTVSDETQTHTPIEKITPQKVAKNFYTPLREKGNQNRDL